MTKQLQAAIRAAYVEAARLHARYDERFTCTGEPRDLTRKERYGTAIEILDPILAAMPWTARNLILGQARDEATKVRETTRAEMQRPAGFRIG